MKVTPLFFTLLLSTQVMAQGDFKFSTIKRNSLERIKFTSNNNGLFRNKTSILDLPGRETKYITETEVRSYIEKTYLTDEVKKSLYFMAGNYDDYLVSVSKWVDSLYDKGLAEFTYHQLVKEEIYRLKLESQIQLDTASENDLYRVMEELEDKMLDGFYESGKGIKYAKEMAGQSLKKSFYPYEEGDSGFDIYNKWYKSNLVIQKQKLLNNQSDLYEQFLVYEKLSRGSIQFDLKSNVMPEYNRLKNLALELKDKDFTSSEYEKVKNDHRDVFTILSSVSFPSLNSSFSQFVNLDQGLKVNQMNYFSRLLDSFEADGSIQESLDLISKAREIVNKFLTENNDKDIVKEKLLKLVDKERKAFQSSEGTYKNFILQVLYQVAGSLLYSELSISDQELAQHFLSSLGQFVNSINGLNSSDLSPVELNQSIKDFMVTSLKKEMIQAFPEEDSELLAKVVQLMVWPIEYKLEQRALSEKTQLSFNIKTLEEGDVLNSIYDQLVNKKVHSILEKYFTGEFIKNYTDSLSLKLSDGTEINNKDALKFVINNR